MSRYSKIPILIPNDVEFNNNNGSILIKGIKGTLKMDIPEGITLKQKEKYNTIIFK